MQDHPHIGHNSGAASKGGACPMCGNADPFDRSDEHHKLFFAIVKVAFDNWPETHPFVPRDAEHLRAWLLIEAKHYKEREFVRPAGVTNDAFRDFLRGWREFMDAKDVRIFPIPNGVRMRVAKSIKKTGPDRVGKKEFQEVSSRVFTIIEATIGLDIEQWKNNQGKWRAA